MVYCLVILFVLGVVIVKKDYRNSFNWILFGLLSGIILILSSILMNCFFSNQVYSYGQSMLFKGDKSLFACIRGMLGVSRVMASAVGNLAITVYTLFLYLLMRQFRTGGKGGWRCYIGVNIVFWLFSNGFRFRRTAYLFFLAYHEKGGERISNLLAGMYGGYVFLLTVVLLFPVWILWLYYRSIRSLFLKRQVVIIFVLTTMLNLFILYEYTNGSMGIDIASALETGFWRRLGSSAYISGAEYVFWPVMVTALTVMIMYTVCNYNKRTQFHFLKNTGVNKLVEKSNIDMRGILHSYKNMLFTLQIYTAQLAEAKTEEEWKAALEKLQKLESDSINEVSRNLNNLRNVKSIHESSELVAAIRKVLNKMPIPAHIKTEVHSDMEEAWINIPESYMADVLENIVSNAVEAMQFQKSGKIVFMLGREKEYIYLKVCDDGPGIPGKEQRKIFRLYYSTKQKNKNWGIGLNYVKNVITNYYGCVWVESKPGRGAEFCFLLKQAGRVRSAENGE